MTRRAGTTRPAILWEVEVRRARLLRMLRMLLTLSACLLATGFSLVGLYARLFGRLPGLPSWFGPWDAIPRALGLDASVVAWPLIVIGLSWIGAVAGLWLRLPWGTPVIAILSGLSALVLGLATALALIAAACLWLTRPLEAERAAPE